MEKELWDAYDREGNPLGFDLVRGESIPEGVFHLVVEVYAVTNDGRVLVTQRHPAKQPFGGLWEVTGGSVCKGETPVEGALRELREETGVIVSAEDLLPVYAGVQGEHHAIYYSFLTFFDPREQDIRLQEGETVAWRLLPWEEFLTFMQSAEYVPIIRDRFLSHKENFERLMETHRTQEK